MNINQNHKFLSRDIHKIACYDSFYFYKNIHSTISIRGWIKTSYTEEAGMHLLVLDLCQYGTQSSRSCMYLCLSKNNLSYYFQLSLQKLWRGLKLLALSRGKKPKKVTMYDWTFISTKLHQGAHQCSMVKMK